MSDGEPPARITINDLFPEGSRVLLTGGGKDFIERIGVEVARRVVLSVMLGENIRTQTEPLTQRRVAQVSGAMLALFARGCLEVEDFTGRLSQMAFDQIRSSRKNDNATIWPAQWLLGLTGKSIQNVLRSDSARMEEYAAEFQSNISQAAEKCRQDIGDLKMSLGFAEDPQGRRIELDWEDIARLTTAIGSQTLTIRGSDKSIYGKLFEKLVLGSLLTVLGFRRVARISNTSTEKVFWLSDSSANRESDATLLYRPGRLIRFDIGFIGPGNSEISKDKLSRYEREMEIVGATHDSITFIVVDRLPQTSKTKAAANKIGAEIIQMSMRYWPRDIAMRLNERIGFEHELLALPDTQIEEYLRSSLANIPIQDFLTGVSVAELQDDAELPEVEQEIEWVEED
jgi:hypothetical protein